jgi:carbon storage regulator
MLVLTRRKNQSIVIGDQIIVTVLEVKGDQIRLGITAPRDVQVFREELLAELSQANRAAVLTDGAAQAAPPTPASARARVHRARRAA